VDKFEEFEGTVSQKPFARGSKSEHEAVVLQTDTGDLVLRRAGANPFRDTELEQLVGKKIRFRGQKLDNILHVTDWTETP